VVNGHVVQDPRTLTEPGLTWPPRHEGPERTFTVPHGNYFVLSDNRTQERDSRSYGALNAQGVRAVVLGTVWHASRDDATQARR
jgi:signal peptidase I